MDGDDRANSWSACGADYFRPQACDLVSGNGAPTVAFSPCGGGYLRWENLGRGGHICANPAAGRGLRLPEKRSQTGTGIEPDCSARPSCLLLFDSGVDRELAREVRRGNTPPAAHRGSGGRGAVYSGAKGIVGDAAQTEPDFIGKRLGLGAAHALVCACRDGKYSTLA